MPSPPTENALLDGPGSSPSRPGCRSDFVADDDAVVAVRIELEEDEVVGHAETFVDPPQRAAGLEFADVVDARAEAEPVERERLAVAPRQIVLLVDDDAAAGPSQGQGCGQAARPEPMTITSASCMRPPRRKRLWAVAASPTSTITRERGACWRYS